MPIKNMVAIQTVTVGAGGAATIEFTSIPQTYTDLVVKLSARSTSANTFENYILTFNGSSQTGMSGRHLYGTGSAAGSGTYSSGDGSIFSVPANVTASTFGNLEMYIPNYTSANNKSISIDNVSENNATAGQQNLQASLWSNSAAITSIRFALSGGNYAQYSTATLYGVSSIATAGAKATGGYITETATHWVHSFYATDTFVPSQNLTCDYLVVAGGGSGGGSQGYSGGGGAGGLRSTVTATGGGGSLETAFSATNGTSYTITVGAGGSGASSGASGSNSSIAGSGLTTITSTGGGRGGYYNGSSYVNPSTGGSGGGAHQSGGGGTGAAGTANQGYAGGDNPGGQGGGGGGAGAVGQNGNSTTNTGGNGGNGVAVAINGTSTYYAGGGGGGAQQGSVGVGGLGGGGTANFNGLVGFAGAYGTGGGGGGSGPVASAGGNGGSGIIVIRYAK